MKIAFITSSLTGGGAERVVSVLANSLSEKDGMEVSIITIIEDKISYELSTKVNYYANNSTKKQKISRIIQRYDFLKNTLKAIDADIVISFCTQINIYSIFAMKGLRGKLIISERNDPNNDPIQRYVRKMRDYIYRYCEYAVFQTPDAAAYFNRIIRGKTAVIMNPIKDNLPDRFEGVRDKRIVSVARLTDVKNHAMLIRAFYSVQSKYQEYKLEIFGEGPERNKLQDLINSLGMQDKISLLGFCANVHERIVSAGCFVLPSNYEGISNSMIEAMGLGLPVICTDCPIGGARMAIQNGVNGILIPVGDEKGLVNAILKILDDSNYRDKLSYEAVKIKEKLSSEQIVNQWIRYIETIL